MDQERIGILLSKLLTGEATLTEQKELESAFREDPSLRETWNALRALKEIPPGGLSAGEEQKLLERGWQRLDRLRSGKPGLSVVVGKQEEPASLSGSVSPGPAEPVAVTRNVEEVPAVRRVPAYRWMAAAAAVFALVIAGAIFYQRNKTAPAASRPAAPVIEKKLVSKYGSRSYIELPDGSKLWLNAGSEVQYATAFAGDKRELSLSGEAYFDVKHDPAHPFIIHTGKLDIKVLGTTFNIKAYPDDSLTETTLIRGKVEVDFANDAHAAIVLKPSEKLIVTGMKEVVQSAVPATVVKEQVIQKVVTAPVVPDPADGTIEETSWVENKLVFRKEPFAQLALRLERWYNVEILFDNEKYQMDELTGTFKDQRIDEVMKALQLTSDFHYRITGGTIHIW